MKKKTNLGVWRVTLFCSLGHLKQKDEGFAISYADSKSLIFSRSATSIAKAFLGSVLGR